MHYYQHHIGDFQRDTASLSDADTLAYLRLIWMYYDTEQPLPNDPKKLAFRIGSNADAVQMLLESFFTLENDVWKQKRCDAELEVYHAKSDRAKNANKIRWGSKMDKKSYPDKIATNNQEPITNKKHTYATPDGVTDSVWNDFVTLRKSKKAAITDTAIKGITREALKANISLDSALRICCERGWSGFKADWVNKEVQSKPQALVGWK